MSPQCFRFEKRERHESMTTTLLCLNASMRTSLKGVTRQDKCHQMHCYGRPEGLLTQNLTCVVAPRPRSYTPPCFPCKPSGYHMQAVYVAHPRPRLRCYASFNKSRLAPLARACVSRRQASPVGRFVVHKILCIIGSNSRVHRSGGTMTEEI